MIKRVEHYRAQLDTILADIQAACHRTGRSSDTITVVAVTKYVDETVIPDLLDAGIRTFGENRWQQARPKLLGSRAQEAQWHFIGHLQNNKIASVVPRFAWIHSIDTLDRMAAVSHAATGLPNPVHCLLQVNISGEASKSGVEPDEVLAIAKEAIRMPGIAFRGFMTMAPLVEDTEETRLVFRNLRLLLDDVRHRIGDENINQLSMGMSNDYVIAVEEGATLVRIGRRLVMPPSDSDGTSA